MSQKGRDREAARKRSNEKKKKKRKYIREALYLQVASTINQVSYNKPAWSFLDGSIQSGKTQCWGL